MWGLLMVSYHSVKFDGHKCCGSADIIFFHLSRDHVIKISYDFGGWVTPTQVTAPPSL